MKKIVFINLIILLAFQLAVQAQNGMPSVSSTTIESTSGSGFICIGEPVIGLFQQNYVLGAGFDYLLYQLGSETGNGETELAFSSLPNPFDDVIHVDIEDDKRKKFLIRVITNNGRIVDEQEQPAKFTYDLGFLSAGIYGLLVHDAETNELLGKKKIMKR